MGKAVISLRDIRKDDNNIVGKKCANLGEMAGAGFRVPPGFALTVDAYARFMEESGLTEKIEAHLASLGIDSGNTSDFAAFEQAANYIRPLVESTPMPEDIERDVRDHYRELCEETGIENIPVSTRSAGPASHPGQYETFLHVFGADDVIFNIKKVWSSTFNQRSIMARAREGISLSFDPIGVAVLKMVNAESAGVMFTLNPKNGDTSKIYIESTWGLGEAVVSGEMSPDDFLLERETLEILRRNISPKTIWYVPDENGKVQATQIPDELKNQPSIDDEALKELARVGIKLEEHFGSPQDVEWALDKDIPFPDNVYMLQTRAVTKKFEAKSTADQIVGLLSRYY